MRHEDSTEVDLIAIRDMVDSMPAPEVEGARGGRWFGFVVAPISKREGSQFRELVKAGSESEAVRTLRRKHGDDNTYVCCGEGRQV